MAFDDGVKTVSGSVAHTDDAATKVPFVSVKCGIEPTLTGVSQVVATRTGENLFDKATVTDNTWIVVNDTTTESAVGYRTSDYIPVKANTKYYVSLKWSNRSAYYDRNKNGIAYFSFSGGASFTCLYDGYIRITIKNDVDLDTFIVNEGNTAITYEPYKGTTYTANLGRTVYGGTADIVKGEGQETWEKKVYTGANNEYWVLSKSGDVYRYYVINDNVKQPTGRGVVYSSIGQYSASGNEVGTCFTYYSSGINRVLIYYIPPQTIQTVEDFRVWLQSNNFDVVYEKATPTDFTFTPITPTPETVGNVNNVYCNTGDTELTYYDNAHGFAEVTVNKTGKNLFDISKVATTGTTAGISWSVSGNEITISGTATSSGWKTFVEFKLPHKGTYHFHMNATGNVGYFLRGWTQLVGKDVTEVCNDPTQVYRIAIAVTTAGQTYEGTISEIQIEVGDAYTSYEPYEAVSKTAYLHKVIYGGQADVIRGTCEPKNLWEFGDKTVDATYIPLVLSKPLPAGNYVVSAVVSSTYSRCDIRFRKEDGSAIISKNLSASSPDRSSTTVTLTEPAYRIYLYSSQGQSGYTATWSDIQIEKGSTASEYTPHFEPFSFTPISIETDEGENTLFANEGDSAITYRKAVD